MKPLLGSDRANLPEFLGYKDLLFEVQVRTVLQHAWAEIEHDRNYKFSGILPTQIQRRLHAVAGTLEIIDREFVAVSKEIEGYAKEVGVKTAAGDLNIEINSTSLIQFLPSKNSPLHNIDLKPLKGSIVIEKVIEELKGFGINTLEELTALYTKEVRSFIKKYSAGSTHAGVLRHAMLLTDIDKYFESAWNHHWNGLASDTVKLLKAKYGEEKIDEIMEQYDIDELKD